MTPKPSTARSVALGVLGQVLSQNRFASEALDHALQSHVLPDLDRGLTTQLVYGVLREKGFLDAILSEYISFEKTPAVLQNLLRLGSYQILMLEKIPEHAAVYETVELAKGKGGAAAASLANAVLRRVAQAKDSCLAERSKGLIEAERRFSGSYEDLKSLGAALSLPPWLLKRWRKHFSPQEILDAAAYFNAPAPLYLRVNRRKGSRSDLAQELLEAGVKTRPGEAITALQVEAGEPRHWMSLVQSGKLSLQDLGSQKIVQALQAQAGERGLDACAGHGGKLSGIAEGLPEGAVLFAHEPIEKKREELQNNFQRLGLTNPKWLQGPQQAQSECLDFDWILVDAPCSGTGTLGRKPEIRWRLRSADLARHAELQTKILAEWLPVLKLGGRLLYSVCSLEPEEGSQVIQAVLQKNRGLVLDEECRWIPGQVNHDGFYWARILKKQDLRD